MQEVLRFCNGIRALKKSMFSNLEELKPLVARHLRQKIRMLQLEGDKYNVPKMTKPGRRYELIYLVLLNIE